MSGRERDIRACEKSLNKCERELGLALHLLRDIDMKLTHIIERMKQQRYNVDNEDLH